MIVADKYNSQFSSMASQYAYYHEEDESSFHLVDTSRMQKPIYQRGRGRFNQVGYKVDKSVGIVSYPYSAYASSECKIAQLHVINQFYFQNFFFIRVIVYAFCCLFQQKLRKERERRQQQQANMQVLSKTQKSRER